MDKVYANTLMLLRRALNTDTSYNKNDFVFFTLNDWKDVYHECKMHGILALTYEVIEKICIEQDIKKQWFMDAMQQIAWGFKLLEEQKQLLLLLGNWHPVIIKGVASAYYYMYPEKRQMGDIDVIVLDANIEFCKEILLVNEYRIGEETRQHVSFEKNGVLVELHRRNIDMLRKGKWFDSMDYVVSKAEMTQEIMISEYMITIFDDVYNGLIILTHLLHHMAGGIGLRQLLDWRMFAERCLIDDYWYTNFRPLVEDVGIIEYTKIITRTCQIYLGLRQDITWCQDVSTEICDKFIDYVMKQGNFGNKTDYNNLCMDVMFRSSGIKNLFMNLQRQGEFNWGVLKKYPQFAPFAWIYQSIRYIKRGCEQKINLKDLKRERKIKKEMDDLFQGMGLK